MNAIILLLHHLIELGFLVGIQQLPHLGDGGGAQAMNFPDFFFASHGIVLDKGHGLLMLVHQDRSYFGLLICAQVQRVGKYLDLIIDV